MIAVKACRSLKCLPLLPRSPFDRNVTRRAPKVRPAMCSAAPAVLPMCVSCYDTCVQFCAVPALASHSAGEGCECPWHFLMYTMYLNTMSPLLSHGLRSCHRVDNRGHLSRTVTSDPVGSRQSLIAITEPRCSDGPDT
ncbi:hypothetical protein B0H17DRAFT_1215480 [Mycena rosella]|uniref:Uncharacterized protein n=1 Tax=Mycena rosella TaxID=1033263 RepID=A0AAD7CHE1_MYCRO|nr:hypothetical protein B0H17DRAFT_1215480 [Mycena rosella]